MKTLYDLVLTADRGLAPAPPGEETDVWLDGKAWELLVKTARNEAGVAKCRKCGCSELQACSGGCRWVEPDLCSECMKPVRKAKAKR